MQPNPSSAPQPPRADTPPSRRRAHLALFIFALTGGGAQRRTLTLARAFAERGLRVDLVVVSGHGPLVREVPDNVRLVVLHPHWRRVAAGLERRVNLRGLETLVSIPALAGYLRRERPDVLLSAASHVNLVAVWARRLARVPLRLVLRASNEPLGYPAMWPVGQRAIRRFLRWMAKRVYPWADAVIAVSDGVGDAIARLTEMPRARIVTVYSPIVTPDLFAQAREPIAHPWLAPGQPPLVLGIGTLKIQKDFATLIRAFARLRRTQPARLVILGDGPLRPVLERLVHSLGLEADVALPGYVDNPYAWMARASVFVLSSAWEGLPGVLVEAMACGCPVVSTDCASGPSEILDKGLYGPLVPVHDPVALADAIGSVLDEPLPAEPLRLRASAFSLGPAVDAYLRVLLRDGEGAGRTRLSPTA
jgi:glycosyltransferase involved in cell wall biosynthesis